MKDWAPLILGVVGLVVVAALAIAGSIGGDAALAAIVAFVGGAGSAVPLGRKSERLRIERGQSPTVDVHGPPPHIDALGQ